MEDLIKEKFSQLYEIIKDIRRFLYIDDADKLSNEDVDEIFNRSKNLEVLITGLFEKGLKEDFELWCVSMKYMVQMNDLLTVGDLVIAKFMSQRVRGEIAFEAIKRYIHLFGESRLEKVCSELGNIRKTFVAVSTLANVRCSLENVHVTLLLEYWSNLMLQGCEDEVIQLIDNAFLSEDTMLNVDCLPDPQNSSSYKSVVNVVYSHALQRLSPFDLKIWNFFTRHKIFFINLINMYPDQVVSLIFENFNESAKCHKCLNENWICEFPEIKLSISHIVQIVGFLKSVEVTYNKIKLFMREEKTNVYSQFWSMIEQKYYFDQ